MLAEHSLADRLIADRLIADRCQMDRKLEAYATVRGPWRWVHVLLLCFLLHHEIAKTAVWGRLEFFRRVAAFHGVAQF